MTTRIPKIIHQIWFGPKKAPLELMRTWKDRHPDFTYMFWNEELLRTHFPNGLYNQKQFDDTPAAYGKSDIARYEILHQFGGIYIDADSICLRKLDDFLLEKECFVCWENERMSPGLLANCFIGAAKDNRLMKMLMEAIHQFPKEMIQTVSSWEITGPGLLTEMCKTSHYSPLSILPSKLFMPRHHTGTLDKTDELPYGFHLFGSTQKDLFFDYETFEERELLEKIKKLLNL